MNDRTLAAIFRDIADHHLNLHFNYMELAGRTEGTDPPKPKKKKADKKVPANKKKADDKFQLLRTAHSNPEITRQIVEFWTQCAADTSYSPGELAEAMGRKNDNGLRDALRLNVEYPCDHQDCMGNFKRIHDGYTKNGKPKYRYIMYEHSKWDVLENVPTDEHYRLKNFAVIVVNVHPFADPGAKGMSAKQMQNMVKSKFNQIIFGLDVRTIESFKDQDGSYTTVKKFGDDLELCEQKLEACYHQGVKKGIRGGRIEHSWDNGMWRYHRIDK